MGVHKLFHKIKLSTSMKGLSLFYFSAMIAITMEKCRTRYILVNIGDAKEMAKSNHSVELLRELNVDKDNRRQSEEWLHFLHLKTNWYMGDPDQWFRYGDRGNLIAPHKSPGEHTICDINGNSLKLSDVKTGMLVKIRAKNVHWPGYDYLYTADGIRGNIWYDWFRETGTAAGDKQTWIVKMDPSDTTFFFESTYWNKGNYLIGPESIAQEYCCNGKREMALLWCDDDSGGVNRWNVTPSSL